MNLCFLHLTDFHVSSPDDLNNPLSEGFYPAYLNGLCKAITENIETPISKIFFTGDLVDRGSFENFEYCSKLLKYTAKKLKIGEEKIYLCHGNHDIDLEKHKNGDEKGAREEIDNFLKFKNFGKLKSISERCGLYESRDGISIVCLDSMKGSEGRDRPGKFTRSEEADICKNVIYKIPEDNILFILSHHPVIVKPALGGVPSDENWENRHIWNDAKILMNHITHYMGTSHKFWLAGDVHTPSDREEDGIFHITTGRFGTQHDESYCEQIRRQARVVEICDSGEVKMHTFNWQLKHHDPTVTNGEWEYNYKVLKKSFPEPTSIEHADVDSIEEEIEYHRTGVPEGERERTKASFEIQIIDDTLQEQIVDYIRYDDSIYKLGRFSTHSEYTCLSWVNASKLLSEGENGFLEKFVEKSFTCLKREVEVSGNWTFEDTLLIGLDFWGSIISTQLGARTGSEATFFNSRGPRDEMPDWEKLDDDIVKSIASKNHLIFVSDIVGTGITLERTHKEIVRRLEGKGFDHKSWYLICLSACPQNKLLANWKFLKKAYVATDKLKIIVVENNSLPDEYILEPDIVFR